MPADLVTLVNHMLNIQPTQFNGLFIEYSAVGITIPLHTTFLGRGNNISTPK